MRLDPIPYCDQRGVPWWRPSSTSADPQPDRTYMSVEACVRGLQATDPKWRIDFGVPDDSQEWIHGADLRCATAGPFHALLQRIGERFRIGDRRTIAASFALRFGWSASVAIAPFLLFDCVPEVGLDNISLRFRADTLYERTAIHVPRGTMLRTNPGPADPLASYIEDPSALLLTLRLQLRTQAAPVVDALYEWAGFSKKGAWGQITSSWASQFVNIFDRMGDQSDALAVVQAFFEGDDDLASMRPKLHLVTLGRTTHLYQRRASCCRYYLLPQGSLCASCPLVSQSERLRKNLDWMRTKVPHDERSMVNAEATTALKPRPSARLLILDAQNRLLLFRFLRRRGVSDSDSFWATPGGRLETGQTFSQAAVRELFEETGIEAHALEPEISLHEFTLQLADGEYVVAEERFFMMRTENTNIRKDGWTPLEKELMREHRWWTVSELMKSKEVIFPENIVALLQSIGIHLSCDLRA